MVEKYLNKITLLKEGEILPLDWNYNEKVDIIIVDPPYEIKKKLNMNNLKTKGKDYSTYNGEWDTIKPYSEEMFKALKENSLACVFATQHNLFIDGYRMKKSGFEIINIIKWVKPDAMPNLTRSRLKQDTEFIIVGRKGKSYYFDYNYSLTVEDKLSAIGKQLGETWIVGKTKGGKRGLHPCQKPEWIIERLLKLYTKENDIVLDFFAGSGTTGIVAKKLNRNFIMFDCIEKYVITAQKRLEGVL